jgi:hypothetical protein
MQNIGLIKKPTAIRDWLTRLGLWEGASAIPPAHAPPVPVKTILWGVDTWDSRIVEFEPGMEMVGLPDRHRHKSPRERARAYTLASDDEPSQEVREMDESQVPTWTPPAQSQEDGLLLVFDGDQPPSDDLPVFWTD